MAQEPTTVDAERLPNLERQGEEWAFGATSPKNLDRWGKWFVTLAQEAGAAFVGFLIQKASAIAIKFAEAIMRAEDRNAPAFRALTRTAIRDLTGVDPGAGNRAIGTTLLQSLSGGAGAQAGGELAPSDAGAAAYMEVVMQLALEGYVEGGITSALSAGFLDKFTELDDILAQVLGLGRMSRRVMQPLMGAKVITPFQWHVNKQYRPELLSAGAAVEAFLAGRLDGVQLVEELARQGWSDERINHLVANARKRLSFSDLVYQHFRGRFSDVDVLQRAGELGYDQATAAELLDLETAKRQDRWKAPYVDAVVAAFFDGEIGETQLRALVEANAPSHAEAQFIISTAVARHEFRRRALSSSRVRQLVILDVLSVVDFRRAMERENWTLEAIAAEELALRMELQDRRDRAAALAQQQRARIEEEELKRAEKAARDAELAARKALPALAEYRRAYVRGIITRDAFAAAIVREKIAITGDDLTVLLADADLDRAEHLEQLERREQALARQPDPTLSLAALEQSVLEGIHTLPEFDAILAKRQYDDDERRLLTALLQARLDDRDQARQAKAAAAARAQLQAISLGDFERAVRLGVRSREQYAALLDQLETPQVARALILDLLDADVKADAEARRKREAAEQAATQRGIALATRRRAVLEGIRPRAYYEAALRDAGLPVDDQLVELALLDREIAGRQADQARRDAIAAEHEAARLERERRAAEQAARDAEPPPAPTLSLAQLERAVKLGLLPPDALRAELRGRGYGPDDVELAVALVVASIPQTRQAETRERTIGQELAARNVSLAALQEAVFAGIRTLDEYETQLAAFGYGPDDVVLQRFLLEDRVALERARLESQLRARLAKIAGAPPLEEILAAVGAGEIALEELRQALEGIGVEAPLALLYARMVGAFGVQG